MEALQEPASTNNLLEMVLEDWAANLNNVSVLTQEDTVIAIQTIDRAINQISQNQARLGAIQNRMQHNIDNLMSQVMQTGSARGRIVDADFASETAKLMKDQILQQAAMQAMNMALNSKQGLWVSWVSVIRLIRLMFEYLNCACWHNLA